MSVLDTPPACPRCRSPMKLRSGARGTFWSCSTYPLCRGTVDAASAEPRKGVPLPPPRMGVPEGALPVSFVAPSSVSLDRYQKAAAEWRSGWAVVAASAGSGKTTLLIERTADLLREGGIPESILLLVYNRAAADLIRSRLSVRCGEEAAGRVGVYTFHAWAFSLLRCWYPGRFLPGSILGGSDGPHPIKVAIPIIEGAKLDIPWVSALKCAERVTENMAGITDHSVAEAMGWLEDGKVSPSTLHKVAPYRTFCRLFAEEKQKRGLIDFTDMLCEVALSILHQPDQIHVQLLRTMYRHIMVDEAQDANLPRMVIARWLGQGAASLLAVGDLRQSIARYAGARPDIFLAFAHTPGVSLLSLPVNRRSSRRVVAAANRLADARDWNLGGETLPSEGAGEGEVIQTWIQGTPREEVQEIAEDIRRRIASGVLLEQDGHASYVCLARTNALLVDLEHGFVSRGVPVRVAGSPGGLLATDAAMDLLAYLEGAEGIPSFGLLRVANQPKRFAKKSDVGAAVEEAVKREKAGQGADVIGVLSRASQRGVVHLGRDLLQLSRLSWQKRALRVAQWLGLEEEDEEEGKGGEDRRAVLEAILKLVQQLGSLRAVYEYKKEVAKGDKVPAVILSTIHSAKGQEWPVVYVTGVRSGKLPHKRCTSPEDLEEELRLLYVAVTRARDVCILTTGGPASSFLSILNQE